MIVFNGVECFESTWLKVFHNSCKCKDLNGWESDNTTNFTVKKKKLCYRTPNHSDRSSSWNGTSQLLLKWTKDLNGWESNNRKSGSGESARSKSTAPRRARWTLKRTPNGDTTPHCMPTLSRYREKEEEEHSKRKAPSSQRKTNAQANANCMLKPSRKGRGGKQEGESAVYPKSQRKTDAQANAKRRHDATLHAKYDARSTSLCPYVCCHPTWPS